VTGRKLSLRTRLLALQILVFGILLLASPITYVGMSRSLHRERDAYLVSLTRFMVADWQQAGGPEDRASTVSPPRPCFQVPVLPDSEIAGAAHRPRHLLVVNAAGVVLCSDGELRPLAQDNARRALETFEPEYSDVRWESEVLRIVSWPFHDVDGVPLVMEVGTSFMVIEGVLRRGLVLTVGIEAVMLGMLLSGSWFLTRRAFAPIDRIIDRVERIGEDNLADRLPDEGTDDQTGKLVHVVNRMLERLQCAFEAESRFSSDVAHEIRSPLTALRGQIEVALRRDRTPDEYRQVLQECLDEVLRLSRLAEDLMSLARADAGTLRIQRQVVDLRETLHEVLRRCRPRAQEKDIDLKLQAVGPVRVEGDPELLTRVVENLVDNALIHCRRMDEVVVTLEKGPRVAVVTVADRGPGIPSEHLEHIFDRFYRVDPARSRDAGGTGLGLAIVREIAGLHGGTVTVESEVGRGSVFRVTLPADRPVDMKIREMNEN
jgi:two-component system OmpR family sensor kinase